MTRGRHSLASRILSTRRRHLVAAPVITCVVIGAGIAVASGEGEIDLAQQAPASLSAASSPLAVEAERSLPLSRSSERTAIAPKETKPAAAKPTVVARRWTTADLDLRTAPQKDAATKGELEARTKVAVTGLHVNGFAQVIVKQTVYWVTNDYLAVKKPAVRTAPAALPIAGSPCPGSSGIESGITSAAVRVYRAVCNNFPQITSYGGYDPHGEHASGRAVDIMTSDVALGNAIAEFLRANARELNLYSVIWRQRIFTQQRASEGWRSMPSRGSATANHYDHVHVSVN